MILVMDNEDGGFTDTFDLRGIRRNGDEVTFELLDDDGDPFSNVEITVPLANWLRMGEPMRIEVNVKPAKARPTA